MNKTILASAALLLLTAACQPAQTEPPVEAQPDVEAPRAGSPEAAGVAEDTPPPQGAANLFAIYGTGVKGVYLLVDRDTGCEWIGTSLSAQHQGSFGFTSVTPRMKPHGMDGRIQMCRPAR